MKKEKWNDFEEELNMRNLYTMPRAFLLRNNKMLTMNITQTLISFFLSFFVSDLSI